ncbi:hypothetical protein JCM16814_17070 [Desulfobaculum senezii]
MEARHLRYGGRWRAELNKGVFGAEETQHRQGNDSGVQATALPRVAAAYGVAKVPCGTVHGADARAQEHAWKPCWRRAARKGDERRALLWA